MVPRIAHGYRPPVLIEVHPKSLPHKVTRSEKPLDHGPTYRKLRLPPTTSHEKTRVRLWPIMPIPRLIGIRIIGPPAILGSQAVRQAWWKIADGRSFCRFERVADCPIIAPRRSNSAHLHRPWRANNIEAQKRSL